MNNINKLTVIKLVLINFSLFFIIFFNACKKETNNEPAIETAPVTAIDIDGNVYKTVKIGKQWWMAENLKVKRYRNGDSITYVAYVGAKLDSALWNKNKTGAYCIYGDSKDTTFPNYNGKQYGFLYNWYAISNVKNIAPAGWHVPTDDEWKTLEMYLGMSKDDADKVNWRGTNEGNKLKIQRSGVAWAFTYPNSNINVNQFEVYGPNESGFSALGSSCIMFNGIEGFPGTTYTGFWWTATENDTGAWYRYLDFSKPNVFRFYGPKTYGFSVRCIKDSTINE